MIPNLAKTSCGPIVKYAEKKKVDVFMHSSEGMYYSDKVQSDKYPIHLIKKVKKNISMGKKRC